MTFCIALVVYLASPLIAVLSVLGAARWLELRRERRAWGGAWSMEFEAEAARRRQGGPYRA
jgi:hypothetical protein